MYGTASAYTVALRQGWEDEVAVAIVHSITAHPHTYSTSAWACRRYASPWLGPTRGWGVVLHCIGGAGARVHARALLRTLAWPRPGAPMCVCTCIACCLWLAMQEMWIVMSHVTALLPSMPWMIVAYPLDADVHSICSGSAADGAAEGRRDGSSGHGSSSTRSCRGSNGRCQPGFC